MTSFTTNCQVASPTDTPHLAAEPAGEASPDQTNI
jgi:hypothetical protein